MLPIVKTVYLLRLISCARFKLNCSIFLLCEMKTSDEKNTRFVYLLVVQQIKSVYGRIFQFVMQAYVVQT